MTGRGRQKGQALVFGLFLMAGGLAALFFLFNTGQLTEEKTKLVNTADAVAYSAGVMHARTLNFEAYTNRAMLANTVAIAQLTSLSSWLQHVSNMSSFGVGLNNPKFVAYYPSYFFAQSFSTVANDLISSNLLKNLAEGSDGVITGLQGAQAVAYGGLLVARKSVMDEVARANYRDDGTVSVDDIPLTATEFTSFVSRYTDDKRTRFKEVAEISAHKDSFVKKRSWSLPALWSDCAGANPFRKDWLSRRGGTELVGFDEWKAIDTLSEWRWVPKNKTDVLCRAVAETPTGWGAQTAADSPALDIDPSHYDSALPTNPGSFGLAAALATTSAWNYHGLPSFYDLSEDMLKEADPRMKFAIRLRRDKSQTVTSDARSKIKPSPHLNPFTAKPAKDVVTSSEVYVAVGASEVYFERPFDDQDNRYGSSLGKPREIGSLFNPYWQVRLWDAPKEVKKAQALQGVEIE